MRAWCFVVFSRGICPEDRAPDHCSRGIDTENRLFCRSFHWRTIMSVYKYYTHIIHILHTLYYLSISMLIHFEAVGSWDRQQLVPLAVSVDIAHITMENHHCVNSLVGEDGLRHRRQMALVPRSLQRFRTPLYTHFLSSSFYFWSIGHIVAMCCPWLQALMHWYCKAGAMFPSFAKPHPKSLRRNS